MQSRTSIDPVKPCLPFRYAPLMLCGACLCSLVGTDANAIDNHEKRVTTSGSGFATMRQGVARFRNATIWRDEKDLALAAVDEWIGMHSRAGQTIGTRLLTAHVEHRIRHLVEFFTSHEPMWASPVEVLEGGTHLESGRRLRRTDDLGVEYTLELDHPRHAVLRSRVRVQGGGATAEVDDHDDLHFVYGEMGQIVEIRHALPFAGTAAVMLNFTESQGLAEGQPPQRELVLSPDASHALVNELTSDPLGAQVAVDAPPGAVIDKFANLLYQHAQPKKIERGQEGLPGGWVHLVDTVTLGNGTKAEFRLSEPGPNAGVLTEGSAVFSLIQGGDVIATASDVYFEHSLNADDVKAGRGLSRDLINRRVHLLVRQQVEKLVADSATIDHKSLKQAGRSGSAAFFMDTYTIAGDR